MDHAVTPDTPAPEDPSAMQQGLAVLSAIAAMEENLVQATAMIAGGEALDLAGLDAEIGRLCSAAQAAPDSMKPALRRALQGLLGRLDGLQKALPVPMAPPA